MNNAPNIDQYIEDFEEHFRQMKEQLRAQPNELPGPNDGRPRRLNEHWRDVMPSLDTEKVRTDRGRAEQ